MKKMIVALVLAAGVTAIAFAAFDSSGSQKAKTEKKAGAKDKKKQCMHTCMYSI